MLIIEHLAKPPTHDEMSKARSDSALSVWNNVKIDIKLALVHETGDKIPTEEVEQRKVHNAQ